MKKLLPILTALLFFACTPEIGPEQAAQQALTATSLRTAQITAETAGVPLPDLRVIKNEIGTWDISPCGILRYGLSLVQETVSYRWAYQFGLATGSLKWMVRFDCYVGNTGFAPFVVRKSSGQNVSFEGRTITIYPSMVSLQGYENGKKIDSVKKKVSFSFSDGPKLLTAGPTYWFGMDTMWISPGYADVYNNPYPVPEINGRPKPGRYVLKITINGEHYWLESNYSNNDVYIGFTIDETGNLTMDESNIELNKPQPVENLAATKNLKGKEKYVSLTWQSDADRFKIYKDGLPVGESTANSFTDLISGGFKGALYEVVAVNDIGESTHKSIYVTR